MTSGDDEPDIDDVASPGDQPADQPADDRPTRTQRPPRVPYFHRAPPPHDWRWVVGGIGKALITAGLLMFAFVGYQLWGTGIETARHQDQLESEFEELLSATTTTPPTTVPPSTTAPDPATTSTTSTTTIPIAPTTLPIDGGAPVAQLIIPKIGLDWVVVEGVTKADLKKGPGHFRETPMPGQLGNAALAGHRTTYGAPFGDIDELAPGDPIEVITPAGHFTYSVTETVIVEPSEYAAVVPTVDPSKATLVLTTCHPEYTSDQRMVVRAVLVPEMSDQVMWPPYYNSAVPTETTLPDEEPDTTVDDTVDDTVSETTVVDTTLPAPTTTAPDDAVELEEDGFSGGWFDDTSAIPHALVWGLLLLAVGVGAFYAGKAAKRLYVSFLVGALPFVVVMYFFFENVNRLLPPGL